LKLPLRFLETVPVIANKNPVWASSKAAVGRDQYCHDSEDCSGNVEATAVILYSHAYDPRNAGASKKFSKNHGGVQYHKYVFQIELSFLFDAYN
jgi:hypothetical protein